MMWSVWEITFYVECSAVFVNIYKCVDISIYDIMLTLTLCHSDISVCKTAILCGVFCRLCEYL